MDIETELKQAKDKSSDLEKRVIKLENYWYITIGVAAILGLGGAYLGTTLGDAKKQMDALKAEIESARTAALRDIDAAKARTVSETRASAEAVVTDLRVQRFNTWLAEERAQRVAKDQALSRWTLYVYDQAVENGDTARGANGWWQSKLKENRDTARAQLQ